MSYVHSFHYFTLSQTTMLFYYPDQSRWAQIHTMGHLSPITSAKGFVFRIHIYFKETRARTVSGPHSYKWQ